MQRYLAAGLMCACTTGFILADPADAQSLGFSLGPGGFVNNDYATDWEADVEVTLAGDGHGTWIAAWLKEENWSGSGTYRLVASRSLDNGATWGWPDGSDYVTVQCATNGFGVSDPGSPQIATDGQGHWVVVWPRNITGTGDADVFFSTYGDGDENWSTPQLLLPSMDSPADNGDVTGWALWDRVPSLATDGEGAWVVVWVTVDFEWPWSSWISAARSFDNGATWTEDGPSVAWFDHSYADWPRIATDCHGTWIMVYPVHCYPGAHIEYSRSTNVHDPGQTPTWQILDGPGVGLDPDIAAACDDPGGVFVATWMKSFPCDNYEPIATTTLNGGDDWSLPVYIAPSDPPGTGGWHRELRVGTDGFVWVAAWWYPEPLYLAYSTNSGLSWTEVEEAGEVYPDLTSTAAVTGAGDAGIRLAYDTSGAVDGLPDPGDDYDIFCSKLTTLDCNHNGVDDADDLAAGTSVDCNSNSIPDECEDLSGGDFNRDGDVDLTDFASFVECLGGPDSPASPLEPQCRDTCLAAFDFDADDDVDLEDFSGFQEAFTD